MVSRRMVLAQDHEWFFPVPEYEFRVARAWKGVLAPTIRLLGGYSNCAYVFRANTSYLVFAGHHWERPGLLSSSICDPTKPAVEATSDFGALGEPTAAFTPTGGRANVTAERIQAYAVAGIAVAGNLLRHTSDRGSWSYLSVPAAVLAVLALIALILSVVSFRRWRRALAALLMSILLTVLALVVAGHSVYQDTWFSRYLE